MGSGSIRRGRLLLGALITLVAFGALTASARAGQWAQISCVNPNGSSAPSQGWTTSASGTLVYPALADASCGPGTPMESILPMSTTGAANSSETLTYTPATGSTLAGGTMSVQESADGYGSMSSGAALVMSPLDSTNDEVETCAHWSDGCWSGEGVGPGGASDFSGPITLPTNAGGTVSVVAACLALSGGSNCDAGGSDGVWAGAWVTSADLLLSNDAVPSAGDFTGTILQPRARGIAQLSFTTQESDGPGIYNVTVAVDGVTVYSATPQTNSGECVAQGTYPGTSALEFDYAQPCPSQEAVDVPIDTAGLSDGRHELAVNVSDAAGNTATVYDGYITTYNPVTNPLPRARRGVDVVRVRFIASTRYHGATTRLLSLSHGDLPPGAAVTLGLAGPHHPRLALSHAAGRQVRALLGQLTRVSFRAGDTLVIGVSAPHRRSERIELIFHDGRVPSDRLL